MEPEKLDPSSITISITLAVEDTLGSTVLDLQDTPDDNDAKSALNTLRLKNIGRLTIGYSNEFDALKEIHRILTF